MCIRDRYVGHNFDTLHVPREVGRARRKAMCGIVGLHFSRSITRTLFICFYVDTDISFYCYFPFPLEVGGEEIDTNLSEILYFPSRSLRSIAHRRTANSHFLCWQFSFGFNFLKLLFSDKWCLHILARARTYSQRLFVLSLIVHNPLFTSVLETSFVVI